MENNRGQKKVALINMPFGGVSTPSIGISLLSASIKQRGIPVDIYYFNLDFFRFVGEENYWLISSERLFDPDNYIPSNALVGEWCFSSELYDDIDDKFNEYEKACFKGLKKHTKNRLANVRKLANIFLDRCLSSIEWNKYFLVGFTSTFEQNTASLSLSKKIKKKFPETKIALGGGNATGIMGKTLASEFDFLDIVSLGEADVTFPEIVWRLSINKPISDISGYVIRDPKGNAILTGEPETVANLDVFPCPDYDNYFNYLKETGLKNLISPQLPLEASRGCWWGQKRKCTFCGLNNATIAYRSKSPDVAYNELCKLRQRYGIAEINYVDNILDKEYVNTFITKVAESKLTYKIFLEIKSNHSRKDIKKLGEAGVTHAQPGIESLSSPVLRLMNKGTSSAQNISCLKWCFQYGILPMWNLLYGFPGEDASSFEYQLALLEKIVHLPPPNTVGKIRLDRFSHYHLTPQKYGLKNVKPIEAYSYIYRGSRDNLDDLAYYFDYDYENNYSPDDIAQDLRKFWRDWIRRKHCGSLTVEPINNGSVIIDSRFSRSHRPIRISKRQTTLITFLDRPRTSKALLAKIDKLNGKGNGDSELIEFIQYCKERGVVIEDENRLVSVACVADELLY